MRNQLIDKLAELADEDQRVVLLTADLGFGVVDTFRNRHPDRFVNVGVAEQAMIATATGLAHAGMIPYCYSIGTFASLRGFEFIRNGPVSHHLPVRILGVGPGFDYENDGLTHYAVDDLAVLRSQPQLQIWAPANNSHFDTHFEAMHKSPHPVYVRLPRKSVELSASFKTDHLTKPPVLVLAFGDAIPESQSVSAELSLLNIPFDFHHIVWMGSESEIDTRELVSRYEVCVTVETHYSWSGFGSWILELGHTLSRPPRVVIHGIESLPVGALGSRDWLTSRHMSDPRVTANRAIKAVGNL
jgi:transketolase